MKTHTYIRLFSAALAVSLVGGAILTQAAPAPKTCRARRAVKHVTAKLHARKTANKAQAPYKAPAQDHAAQGVPALPAGPAAAYAPPVVDQDSFRRIDKSVDLAKTGDEAAGRGDWPQATTSYQQALDLWPDNSTALYGLGKAADAAGDTASAVRYYRTATFADNSPHTKWNTQTKDIARLMEFVLLLNKVGQQAEALAVYRRAAHLLNYQDADTNGGKPYLDVLLPEFGNSPSEWAFTPQRMEAMALVGIAYEREDFDHKLAQVELQKAIDLAPDSPVPYFYKGRNLIRAAGHRREALEDFHTAAQLGDEDTKAAADKGLKDWNVEHDAKVEQDREDLQRKQAAQRK